MKTPTNRAKFMDELRANIDDVILTGYSHRYWLQKRSIGEIDGEKCWISYSEEEAPQCIEFESFENQRVRLEFCENGDGIEIYHNSKYHSFQSFDLYKNKISFTATIAIWIERLIRA